MFNIENCVYERNEKIRRNILDSNKNQKNQNNLNIFIERIINNINYKIKNIIYTINSIDKNKLKDEIKSNKENNLKNNEISNIKIKEKKKNNIFINIYKYIISKYVNNYNNKIIFKDNLKIKLYYLIIIIILISKLNCQYLNLSSINNSYIVMKINRGDNYVLCKEWDNVCGYYTRPNEIYINDIKQDKVKNKYDFNETINIVILIWNNTITNCNRMFYYCNNIIEMNLSHFDTSQVTNMGYMFCSCN